MVYGNSGEPCTSLPANLIDPQTLSSRFPRPAEQNDPKNKRGSVWDHAFKGLESIGGSMLNTVEVCPPVGRGSMGSKRPVMSGKIIGMANGSECQTPAMGNGPGQGLGQIGTDRKFNTGGTPKSGAYGGLGAQKNSPYTNMDILGKHLEPSYVPKINFQNEYSGPFAQTAFFLES
jgi:hypothetical protein